MSFEDAWSSCRKRRLPAAPLPVTWPQGPAMHHANRCLPAPACVADPQRDVWRGRVRPSGTPTARDENASPSPTGQDVLPTPLEPETTKPKIGWKMENVSRSTIPVRLLDFRGHREVSYVAQFACTGNSSGPWISRKDLRPINACAGTLPE